MKRQKRLTRKERKQQDPMRPLRAAKSAQPRGGHSHSHSHDHSQHIHCIACGKHLDPEVFGEPDGADFLRCEHGTDFPHCVGCIDKARELVAEHDANEQPVKSAAPWH